MIVGPLSTQTCHTGTDFRRHYFTEQEAATSGWNCVCAADKLALVGCLLNATVAVLFNQWDSDCTSGLSQHAPEPQL